jgi:hypothetical protein
MSVLPSFSWGRKGAGLRPLSFFLSFFFLSKSGKHSHLDNEQAVSLSALEAHRCSERCAPFPKVSASATIADEVPTPFAHMMHITPPYPPRTGWCNVHYVREAANRI